MILKYYDGYMSLNKLSDMLCTNRKGTTAYHMVEVLKTLGFDSDGYKYNDLSSIKCPCIALINMNSYNHYVVIYEINFKKKILVIGDPAKGLVKLNFNEFLNCFEGIVISAILKRKLVKEGEISVLKFIHKLVKPNIKYLLIIGFLSLIVSILSIISSFFIQSVIIYLNTYLLFKIILLFSFLFFVITLTGYLRNIILIKLNRNIDTTLSLNTFDNIIHLPYKSAKNKTTGEVISYFNDLFLIKEVINKIIISIFIDIPLMFIIHILLLFAHPKLFIINIFILNMYIGLYALFKNKNHFITEEVLRKKSLINSFITERVKGYETVRNLNIEKKIINEFNEQYIDYLKTYNKLEKIKNKEFLYKELISSFTIVLTVIYGVYSMNIGLHTEMFITLFLISTTLITIYKNLLDIDLEYEKVKSSINHIGELFIQKNNKTNIKVKGNITVTNLNYSFNKINNVLNNINLNIKTGTKVIVSGKSGSGKSTLFKIIKGYYDDYNGKVKIDKYHSKKSNFENVTYISPKETLFTGRIYDNLNLRQIDLESYKICELDEFICDYNELIEEDGFNISDGQKQRIALARAITNFNILIIDEGLSQVDVNMERRILKKLFQKYSDKTIIFISHRLDNIDLFDRLIKLDSGQVVLDEVRNI